MTEDLIKTTWTDEDNVISAWMEEIEKEVKIYFHYNFLTMGLSLLEFKEYVTKLNSAYSTLDEKGLFKEERGTENNE